MADLPQFQLQPLQRNLQVPDYSQILNLINQGNQQRQSPLATVVGAASQGYGQAKQQSNIQKLLQMYRQFYGQSGGQGSPGGGQGSPGGVTGIPNYSQGNSAQLMPGFGPGQ